MQSSGGRGERVSKTVRGARSEKRSVRSTTMQLSLAFLAPSLVQAIADNRLPRGIGLTVLPICLDQMFA